MATPIELDLPDEDATRALGARLAGALEPGDLVVLEGNLGAGKTFLVRAVARALEVPDEIPVTSPTFTLLHELPGRVPIVHADLYRIEEADELVELGLFERIGADAVVLVEWGERFAEALGAIALVVRLSLAGETRRHVRIEPHGARGRRIAARLATAGSRW